MGAGAPAVSFDDDVGGWAVVGLEDVFGIEEGGPVRDY